MKQTATYTLEAMSEDAWKIGVDIRRIGESQLLLEPDLPKDTAVELVALVRLLKGSLAVDPHALWGTGSLDVSSTIHIRATAPERGSTEEIIEDVGSDQAPDRALTVTPRCCGYTSRRPVARPRFAPHGHSGFPAWRRRTRSRRCTNRWESS